MWWCWAVGMASWHLNMRVKRMNAQPAPKQTSAPQTPSLPQAKPESLGLSSFRLQRMSDAFKREIDKVNEVVKNAGIEPQ